VQEKAGENGVIMVDPQWRGMRISLEYHNGSSTLMLFSVCTTFFTKGNGLQIE